MTTNYDITPKTDICSLFANKFRLTTFSQASLDFTIKWAKTNSHKIWQTSMFMYSYFEYNLISSGYRNAIGAMKLSDLIKTNIHNLPFLVKSIVLWRLVKRICFYFCVIITDCSVPTCSSNRAPFLFFDKTEDTCHVLQSAINYLVNAQYTSESKIINMVY